jgi:hypothetical protein
MWIISEETVAELFEPVHLVSILTWADASPTFYILSLAKCKLSGAVGQTSVAYTAWPLLINDEPASEAVLAIEAAERHISSKSVG